MTTDQNLSHTQADDFVFVGGALALDLVNTEVVVRRKRRDLLATPNDVMRWWELAEKRYQERNMVRVIGDVPAADEEFLPAVLTFRGTLRGIFNAVDAQRNIDTEDLEHLNLVLSLGTPAVEQSTDGQIRVVYRTANSLSGSVLLPVALSAKGLLTEGNLGRIHHCRNDHCILFFYDDTRSATRHWCSVGCMNRARSTRRYHDEKQMADDRRSD